MNIKSQIEDAITANRYFGYSGASGSQQRIKFSRLATRFLNASNYGQSERYARQLINYILRLHEKSTSFGPVLESLNIKEMYGDYSIREHQRLHYSHQLNVYLLGLYIYDKVSVVRDHINREMTDTTELRTISDCQGPLTYRYSSGSEKGEFLYRWRMAAFTHDLGNGISISTNDNTLIQEYLDDISTNFLRDLNGLDDLWKYKDLDENCKNLVKEIDDAVGGISLEKHMDFQYNTPLHEKLFYDHGIMSSLIFFRVMNEEFEKHANQNISRIGGNYVIWDETLLKSSILQIASAIAIHNLEQHEQALYASTDDIRIFNLEERPLAWLLKVSDILQEWDKPKVDINLYTEIIPTSLNISWENEKILVTNLSECKRTKIEKIVNDNISPLDLIVFE